MTNRIQYDVINLMVIVAIVKRTIPASATTVTPPNIDTVNEPDIIASMNL